MYTSAKCLIGLKIFLGFIATETRGESKRFNNTIKVPAKETNEAILNIAYTIIAICSSHAHRSLSIHTRLKTSEHRRKKFGLYIMVAVRRTIISFPVHYTYDITFSHLD